MGHGIATAIVVVLMWLLLGHNAAAIAALVMAVWWTSREHTQAEYRWIEWFGGNLRKNLPMFGFADPRVWNIKSILDWAIPVAIFLIVLVLA